MTEVAVTREQGATDGRYVARMEGSDAEAELKYRRPAPAIVDAFHTGTPPALRGRGIATRLVERLVADARREGFRIVPTCPFVSAQFESHPEWSDLRAT